MTKDTLTHRAAIITEAMPYLRRYSGKVVVVKFGGHAMEHTNTKAGFAADVVLLQQCGIRLVIVHGGGPQIDQMLSKLKIHSTFIDGLRITDTATMEIVEMILSGSINKDIVALIESSGGKAVGISGKDGHMICTQKIKKGKHFDLGLVGEPSFIDSTLITHLFEGDFIPVIAPIGFDKTGTTLNINSDIAAGALAVSLEAKRLLLLSDIPGILDTSGELISQMNIVEAEIALANGTVSGGMLPKLETCLKAVRQGVEASVILDGRNDHATLIELLSDQGSGTLISS